MGVSLGLLILSINLGFPYRFRLLICNFFAPSLSRRLLAAQVEARRKEAEEQAMSLRATLGIRGKQANGGIKPNKTAAVCRYILNVAFTKELNQ